MSFLITVCADRVQGNMKEDLNDSLGRAGCTSQIGFSENTDFLTADMG